MTGDEIMDLIGMCLVLAGALLCLTASIGLLRWRDVPTRLHAATKPQVLGLLLICLAIGFALHAWVVIAFLVAIIIVQLATAPLAAHIVGRTAYRNGKLEREDLYVDQLAQAQREGRGPDQG